ncbi:GNAT family N-acetyltransferase [Rhizobium puerariae]|uniref:GNAT family N-acetyltransferase n=1 Tax=Rhizobium puerariae TaxID=1585791 RepID=A0ABV6ALK8_9HYPH
MTTENPSLPSGYSAVPPGKIANVETRLEMFVRPPLKTSLAADASLSLERWRSVDVPAYRTLFRTVGERWMWTSRLVMADEELAAILGDPRIEIFRLMDGDRAIGLLELDFREEGECELTFFGLVADAIGKGAGRFLMDNAVAIAWSRPIRRFWVHTCSFDHPFAVQFYQRSGFRPYALLVEVSDDPRLTGLMPREASPHVPLIEP